MKAKKPVSLVFFLCVSAGILFGGDSFLPRVPSGTIAYVYFNADEYIRQANEYNPILDLFKEGGKMRAFFDPMFKRWETALKEFGAENDIDVSLKESLGLLKTEMALVIVGGEFAKKENPPAFLFALRIPEGKRETAEALLAVVKKKILENPEGKKRCTVSPVEVGDVEFTKVRFIPPSFNEGKGKESAENRKRFYENNPVIFGLSGDLLCVGTGEVLLERFCNGGGEGSLAEQGDYIQSMERVHGTDAPFKAYFAVDTLMGFLKESVFRGKQFEGGRKGAAVVDAVHRYALSGLKSVSFANTFEGNVLHSRGFFAFPEGDEGLLKAILKNRGKPEVYPVVNEKTYFVSALKCDVRGMYDAVLKLVEALSPAFRQMWEQQKSVLKLQVGVGVDEIVNSFGDNVLIYMYPPARKDHAEEKKPGIVTESMAFLVDLKNPAPLQKMFGMLIPVGENSPFTKTEFMGDAVYEMKNTGMGTAFPAFCISGGRLIIATEGEELRNVIRRASSKEYRLPEKVKKGVEKLEAMEPAGSFMGVEFPERTRHMMELFLKEFFTEKVVKQLAKEFGVEMDMSKLPTYEDLKKYLNLVSYTKGGMVEGGFLFQTEVVNKEKRK